MGAAIFSRHMFCIITQINIFYHLTSDIKNDINDEKKTRVARNVMEILRIVFVQIDFVKNKMSVFV